MEALGQKGSGLRGVSGLKSIDARESTPFSMLHLGHWWILTNFGWFWEIHFPDFGEDVLVSRGFHDASENVSQTYFWPWSRSYVEETLIARLMTSADRAYYRHCGGIRWPMHVANKAWNILERIWTSIIHRQVSDATAMFSKARSLLLMVCFDVSCGIL